MTQSKPVITVLSAHNKVTDGGQEPPGIDKVRSHATVQLAWDHDSLAQHLPHSEILLVTDFRTRVLADVWPTARQLQWIHTTSAGTNHLMFPALRASDVAVTNARGFFDRAISEYVLGTILAFAKDTRGNIEYQQQHEWRHRDSETISQKQVLVVGAGSIGREIGSLCRAVGMRVSGVARSARDGDRVFDRIHATESLPEQLSNADYVVIAAPLTDTTRGLFDDDLFAAMKADARLINVGRGPIVDTDALLRALQARRIAGAALDVFEQEPLPPDHPLWERRDVLMSAHMAGDFIGWREALIDQFLDNFARWQDGEPLFNIVDK